MNESTPSTTATLRFGAGALVFAIAWASLPSPAAAADHEVGVEAGTLLLDAVDPAGSEQLQTGSGAALGLRYRTRWTRFEQDVELGVATAGLSADTHDHQGEHLGLRLGYAGAFGLWSTAGGRGGVGPALDVRADIRSWDPDGTSTWLLDVGLGPAVVHREALGPGELRAGLRLPLVHYLSTPPWSVENADTFVIGRKPDVLVDELGGFALPHELLRVTAEAGYSVPLADWFAVGATWRGTWLRHFGPRGVALADNQLTADFALRF